MVFWSLVLEALVCVSNVGVGIEKEVGIEIVGIVMENEVLVGVCFEVWVSGCLVLVSWVLVSDFVDVCGVGCVFVWVSVCFVVVEEACLLLVEEAGLLLVEEVGCNFAEDVGCDFVGEACLLLVEELLV